MTVRLAVAYFDDEHGVVDAYMIHLVAALKPFAAKSVFVSGRPLTRESEIAVRNVADEVIVLDRGDAFAGYAAALDAMGPGALAGFDEVIFHDHDLFGPLFPLAAMFETMADRACDLWTLAAPGGDARVPGGEFTVVRRSLLGAAALGEFRELSRRLGEGAQRSRIGLADYFAALGYACEACLDPREFGSVDPLFIESDKALGKRLPFLNRRLFLADPLKLDEDGVDLPRSLRILERTSDYDADLIWQNVLRTAKPRVLATNAALTAILPDVATQPRLPAERVPRIAVCAHIYYPDMTAEMLEQTSNIEYVYDLIVTTDTSAKKREIEEIAGAWPGIGKVDVRVMEQNRGRDMAALFIACRDVFLGDDYDLVCRLHSKKTPQVEAARGNFFKRHMLDNTLDSRGYASNVIAMFDAEPRLGMAMAPLIHIAFSTMGHSWFANKPRAKAVAQELGIRTPFDDTTPVAAYGTMFWFRPRALRKLFEREWRWDEFNAEPNHVDGGLAHVLERLIPYCAHDAGYLTRHIMSPAQASLNYAFLEYKFQRAVSLLPLDHFARQIQLLEWWRGSGYPLVPTADTRSAGQLVYLSTAHGVRATGRAFGLSLAGALGARAPWAYRLVRAPYRALRSLVRAFR